MKHKIILPLLLLCTTVFLYSCSKQKSEKKEFIDSKNLTTCPAGAGCSLLFTERADLEGFNTLKSGPYRVFWSEIQSSGITSYLYIKAPMEGNSFELSKSDIQAGRVSFFQSCPSCLLAPLKPMDGYVKGINTTPEKPADQTKWLIEAKIFLRAEANTGLADTLFIKQYFTPNFIFN